MKPVIGLIGGIGSGKSLVAGCFSQLGGYLVEGDKLGHEALRQPAVRDQVVERWGPQVRDSDGEIDRRKLGGIVFANASERKALETLVFPWIERRIAEEIDKAERDPRVLLVVLDAAILLEASWNRFCDFVVFVHAPRQQRLERIAVQRGWSEKEVEAREKAQLSPEEKRARADFVVDNSGDPAQARNQVEQLVQQLRPALPHQTK